MTITDMSLSSLDSLALKKLRSEKSFYESETMKALAGISPVFQNLPPHILIGGTNGKGSTTALMEGILMASGHRVATFITPHLLHPRERIRIQGEDLPFGIFHEALRDMQESVPRLLQKGFRSPSFFEGMLYTLIWAARHFECTAMVIEAGLGGRRDATACLSPQATLITNISLDHAHILGETHEAIAQEKGTLYTIAQKKFYGGKEDPKNLFSEISGIQILSDSIPITIVSQGLEGQSGQFDWNGQSHRFRCPLLGSFQRENLQNAIALAFEIREKFGITPQSVVQGIRQIRHPFRMELLSKTPPLLIDGAHNADGLKKLLDSMNELLPNQKPVLFMGLKRTKSNQNLSFLSHGWDIEGVCLKGDSFLSPAGLKKQIPLRRVHCSLKSTLEAMHETLKIRPVVLCGSLYLVARFTRFWKRKNSGNKKIQKKT